ncbi:DUF3800 domain-containing protein [Sphingomonas sp. ID1715]|uniref:DUF3800 domain-containing protein n=1 Tax=Sphingomonas sp. ID1715 TaxID=1656898 RepID=UPI001488A447|nr:DUF3800 domain-containing protein [Sphingomonas sp. ID1715]NNM76786.1 DUF3800 domain-containing protein [Sphingomonas sp. ID1715]
MAELTFYMDETGNRHPDKKSDQSRAGRDWFGFGGYLIKREDEGHAKQLRQDIADQWAVHDPFHITDMLSETKRFAWLGRASQKQRSQFWSEYRDFLSTVPAIGLACIIDRPGYIARGYLEKHGNDRWLLCRSAFDIAVERAVKFARTQDRKLRIIFESDPSLNATVVGYFDNLKANGLAFNKENSGKYEPLSQEVFASVLTTIEYKPKANPLLQIADSYIYALARGKYDKKFDIWREIRDGQRVMDFALGGDAALIKAMGVKYYCFDPVQTKKAEA